MGTTTNYAIPFPEPTDFVTDGATAMESIAEKVDDVLSTGAAARNLLFNGAMQISQRKAVGTETTGITSIGYYTADRFATVIGSLGTWKQATVAEAPTGSGFINSLKITCTTAYPSPIVGSRYAIISQPIEAQNLQALGKGTASAKPLTLTFWVKSGVNGIYILEIYDSTGRAISKSYTINAVNTWEQKTIFIPADTLGVIPNTNGEGLNLRWWLAAGDSYTSGTLQTSWGASVNANIAVGQTNLAAGNNTAVNYWQMTGVQMTIGSVATPFQFKSFGQELIECQRYYEKSYIQGESVGSNTTNGLVLAQTSTGGDSYWYAQLHYKVTKRTKDVNATFWNSTGATSLWSWSRSGATGNNVPQIQYQSDNWLQIYIFANAAWVAMQAVGHFAVSAEL